LNDDAPYEPQRVPKHPRSPRAHISSTDLKTCQQRVQPSTNIQQQHQAASSSSGGNRGGN
jgi:hypothetical protein